MGILLILNRTNRITPGEAYAGERSYAHMMISFNFSILVHIVSNTKSMVINPDMSITGRANRCQRSHAFNMGDFFQIG